MKPELPDVTLVMLDALCPELARLSVADSLAQANFGDAVAFSPVDLEVEGCRWHRVPRFSKEEHIAFVYYEMPRLIRTKWVLMTDWDSWVIDGSRWSQEFLRYDYVGAPWWYEDGRNVGCGAALRSLRLMRHLMEHREAFPVALVPPEDHVLCRIYRGELEQAGFTWAPNHVACRFSFECTWPEPYWPTFSFHDLRNFPFVLDGERLEERVRLARSNSYICGTGKLYQLDSGFGPALMPSLMAGQ